VVEADLARVVEVEATVLAMVVETRVLARVVLVEAEVLVASTSVTDGAPLLLAVAELSVLSIQKDPVVMLGFGHVDQKTPELAPAACGRSELRLARHSTKPTLLLAEAEPISRR
jgi:hypothetical protein